MTCFRPKGCEEGDMTENNPLLNTTEKLTGVTFQRTYSGALVSSLPVSSVHATGQDALKRGVTKGRINQSVVSSVLQTIGVWRNMQTGKTLGV